MPTPWGVTVRAGLALQLSKVTLLGLTVATAVSLEFTAATSVVEPVRLQPFLPSPFLAIT